MTTTADTAPKVSSLKKAFGLRREPHRFRDLGLAQSFVKSARSSNCIVMGNHPELWVVVPADAAKLVKLGYEML